VTAKSEQDTYPHLFVSLDPDLRIPNEDPQHCSATLLYLGLEFENSFLIYLEWFESNAVSFNMLPGVALVVHHLAAHQTHEPIRPHLPNKHRNK
jgi:hypothetical protein